MDKLEHLAGRVDALCLAVASLGRAVAAFAAEYDPASAAAAREGIARSFESEMPQVLAGMEQRRQPDRAAGYEAATEVMARALRQPDAPAPPDTLLPG